MRSWLLLIVLVCIGYAAPGEVDPEAARIAALVRQLGDDEFEKREEATEALRKAGAKSVTALAAACLSDDLEIRKRANRLLRAIMPKSIKSHSTGLKLARIDAAGFRMGSPLGEPSRRGDETAHEVGIRVPFYMGTHEVTQDEYHEVMKTRPSWFRKGGDGGGKVADLATGRFPVENVSWFDAVEFCNLLSRKDGLPPYYRLTAVKRKGGSIVSAESRILGGKGYRLPTEAEWERACRGDTETAYHHGARLNRGDANLKPILVSIGYGSALEWPEIGRPTTVGSHRPNAFGLHDMHGNVAEWCQDWYGKDYYTSSARYDPKGPDKGTQRVHRGGSWLVPSPSGRAASRSMQAPGEKSYTTGFRVARDP